ncbi:MAG: M23 family metallopeptidase [Lachnospiraceae bacterium]|nr:M23 family metallopeptidase [Lachnospiraceae bacterium]
MKKYSRKNLKVIQTIVQNETGAALVAERRLTRYKIRRMALLTVSLLCFAILCAFAYQKFSSLSGDEAMFAAVYQGEGRFELIVVNESDRELRLQDKVKLMQWSTGREVEGEPDKIRMKVVTIAPHSQGIVSIDLSEGYDISALEEKLPDGDGYYFVLTNNDFVFGQDWMCFFTFETELTDDVESRMAETAEQRKERQNEDRQQYSTGALIYQDWIWPTVSRNVSGIYGKQKNGKYSDHINIAGTDGDDIYAVADGVVIETAFENDCGNFIVVDLGGGVAVRYGHLKEIEVSVGDEIRQGQVIAAMGKTGTATGPNLLFAVTVDGEKINPLQEEDLSVQQ